MTNFRDLTGLRRAATIALCVYIAARALLAIQLLIVVPGTEPIALLTTIYFASLIACYILVACWIYRAVANAHLFSNEMTITPAWSVGWFFIPFANLVMPYAGVHETWRESHKVAGVYDQVESPIVGWWWGMWIAGNIATNIAAWAISSPTSAGPVANFLYLVASGLGIAAAVILIQLMSGIGAAQRLASRGNVFA